MIERRQITSRAEWLQWRKNDLTASDIGAVVGCDEYKSALAVFTDKLGMSSSMQSAVMQRGLWLEHAARAAIRDSYPNWKVIDPNVYIRDTELRLGATPDCLAEDEDEPGLINIQIKSIARPVFERWNGKPPMAYTLQTAAEGLLTNARTSYLAIFVISTFEASLHMIEVPRHAGAEIRITQIARDFWADMAAGRMPKIDFRRDAETVAALYSLPKPDSSVDLSASNRLGAALEEREEIKARIKADTETVAALDTEIKSELGEIEVGILPGWRIYWKNQTRKAYTVPESTSRVLRVYRQDEDE